MTRRALAAAVGAVAVAATAAWLLAGSRLSSATSPRTDKAGTGQADPSADPPVETVRCEPGADADCYPDVALLDVDGVVWIPDVLAGKVVIANYWATWCAPCVEEIPLLAEVAGAHRDDVVVLGLLTNPVPDDELRTFRDEHGLTYPVVRVDADTADAFGQPQVLPTTLVFDRTGRRAVLYAGPVTSEKLDDWLAELR